jgi:hypothetical protein
MTKQEVLQGALALNGCDKKFTVTVDSDKIIIEAKCRDASERETTFCYTACLKDNKTYTFVGYRKQNEVRTKTASCCSEESKEVLDSEEIKKVLIDYLRSCGYKKATDKKLIALCISILIVVVVIISVAVIRIAGILLSSPRDDFVDTNGAENFALTEITRDDILRKDNGYQSFMSSSSCSGSHTNSTFSDYDYDRINRSFGKIHGVILLQATKISGDTLTLNINSSVESGNAEIVITVDGEYHCSVDINKIQFVELQDISNKEVLVKLAGEGAKMSIDVSRVY